MLRVEPRFLPYSMRESRRAGDAVAGARLPALADPAAGRPDAARRAEGLIVHGGKTVSVVFPAYNEEQYIRPAIDDFLIPDVVDEIVVVDNNSRDRTAAEAAATPARVVTRDAAGLRLRAAARARGGDRRHHHPGRAGRHVHRPRRPQAAGLRRRLRHGLRHADDSRVDLGSGEHGLVPAGRELDRRQAAAGAARRPVAQRLRLHAAADAPRRGRADPAAS